MLVIKSIKLNATPISKNKILRRVRLGYDSYICNTRNIPKMHDNESFQWRQDMTLPLIFNRNIQLQFYPSHEFGYNPQEINSFFFAKIYIQNYKKTTIEADVFNSDNQMIGRTRIQYRIVNYKRQQPDVETQSHLSVSSMLAHIENYYGEKGKFELIIFQENEQTPQIDFIAGELLWAQKLKIPILRNIQENKQLKIRVFIDGKLIGESTTTIQQIKASKQRFKKLMIQNVKSREKCGMLFIDLNYKEQRIEKDKQNNKEKSSKSMAHLPPLHSHREKSDRKRSELNSHAKTRRDSQVESKYSKRKQKLKSELGRNPSTNEIFLTKLRQKLSKQKR